MNENGDFRKSKFGLESALFEKGYFGPKNQFRQNKAFSKNDDYTGSLISEIFKIFKNHLESKLELGELPEL